VRTDGEWPGLPATVNLLIGDEHTRCWNDTRYPLETAQTPEKRLWLRGVRSGRLGA
jgi:hypothetical protein